MKVQEIFEMGVFGRNRIPRSMGSDYDTILHNAFNAITKGREGLGIKRGMKWHNALRELGVDEDVMANDAHIMTGVPSYRPMMQAVQKYIDFRAGIPNSLGQEDAKQLARIISDWSNEVRQSGSQSVFRR